MPIYNIWLIKKVKLSLRNIYIYIYSCSLLKQDRPKYRKNGKDYEKYTVKE